MLREFGDGHLNQRVTEVFLEEMIIGLNFGEYLEVARGRWWRIMWRQRVGLFDDTKHKKDWIRNCT